MTATNAHYDAEYLGDGITWIDEVCLRRAGNIWLIDAAPQALLIDTGWGLGDLRGFVSTLTENPVLAVATVGYFDHAGGLNQFTETAIHSLDAHRVINPDPLNTVWGKYFRDDVWRATQTALIRPDEYHMPSTSPTRLLADGETIQAGDRTLQVLHLPGITDGSIGLYDATSGALFTGDTLLDVDPPYDGEPISDSDDSDLKALSRSMQRIGDLPIQQVYPGHGSPYDGTRLRIILREFFERHEAMQS